MLADFAPDAFIRATLAGDAELSAAVASITEHPAPLKAAYPLVTFAPYGNGSDTNTMDGTRVLSNGLWLVRVIGREQSFTDLAPLYARIDTLLQAAKGPTDFGHVYGLVRQSPFRLTELDDGVTYRHAGGIYAVTFGAS